MSAKNRGEKAAATQHSPQRINSIYVKNAAITENAHSMLIELKNSNKQRSYQR